MCNVQSKVHPNCYIQVPYSRKLTLHEIKVSTKININLNVHLVETDFQIKEIMAEL